MPRYQATDRTSGQVVTFDWADASSPTDADIEEVMTSARKFKPTGPAKAKPEPTPVPAIEGAIADVPSLRDTTKAVAPYAREGLELGGLLLGAMVGTGSSLTEGPAAPLTAGPKALAGGGLGFAMGRGAANMIDEFAGTRTPPSVGNRMLEAGRDVLYGGAQEAFGRVLGGPLVGKGAPHLGSAEDIARLRPPSAAPQEQGFLNKMAEKAGNVLRPAIGRLTGAYTGAADEALKSGRSPEFTMKGDATPFGKAVRGKNAGEDIVEEARAGLSALKEKRTDAYRVKLAAVERGTPSSVAAEKVAVLDENIAATERARAKATSQLERNMKAVTDEASGAAPKKVASQVDRQIWRLEQDLARSQKEGTRFNTYVADLKAQIKAATDPAEKAALREEFLELKASGNIATKAEAKMAKDLEKLKAKRDAAFGQGRVASEKSIQQLDQELTKLQERRGRIIENPEKPGEFVEFAGVKSIDITPIHQKLDKLMKQYGLKYNAEGEVVPVLSSSALGSTGLKDAKEIVTMVRNWGKVKGERTPLGLDTLKRSLDDFYSDSSSARQFVASLRQSVNDTIAKDVPMYREMTKEYREATRLIREIEKGLGLRSRGGFSQLTADQTLRRLMGSMRDNAALRKDLVDLLGKETGEDLTAKIAGYTMRSPLPLGIRGAFVAATAEAALMQLVSPHFWPVILSSSPRLQGEFLQYFAKAMAEARVGVPFAARAMTHKMLNVPEADDDARK